MKLNNRGWGFGMMIFLMSILIIFFAIAIYFIYKIYNNLEIPELSQSELVISRRLI